MTESAEKLRLSDLILQALQLSINQEDVAISDLLKQALDLSMTRNSGGSEFVERRVYPDEINEALQNLYSIRGED